jgi:hypothetical protein
MEKRPGGKEMKEVPTKYRFSNNYNIFWTINLPDEATTNLAN